MSLLLDARKKSLQAKAGHGNTPELELSLEPVATPVDTPNTAISDGGSQYTDHDRARLAGQNLFNAKSGSARPGINRNLLIALGGTVILLAAGGAYVWYQITPSKAQLRPILMAARAAPKPVPAPPPPQNDLVPGIVSAQVTSPKPARVLKPRHVKKHLARATPRKTKKTRLVHIVRSTTEPIDPLLNNAYLAYRSGKLDQSQQLYLKALNLDANNSDALLGLAVIAQRRSEDNLAAHYYAQVLALDPRNAVANAGMSALSGDDNSESRLKTLLNEQQNSSSLHFALGNYYAEHARWAEAQQSYFDAYKLAPDRAELAFNLAVSLDRLGQSKAAALYYRRALQLDPGHLAEFNHGKISQRLKELTH